MSLMIQFRKHRIFVARATKITMAALGMVAGYFLGCALAIQFAGNWLNHYSTLVAVQDDAAFQEARQLLGVLKNSPHPFCSEAEIAYFRELIFRSEYLKDAGRIRSGKMECSAIAGHPMKSVAQLNQQTKLNDGTIAYNNLAPFRDAKPKWAGLQLGTAYVVFGSPLPASTGPVPLHLSVTAENAPLADSPASANGAKQGDDEAPATDATKRVGNMLYATKCSAFQFSCVTASASVSEAMSSQKGVIAATTFVGGALGILLGMAFFVVYNQKNDLHHQLRRAVSQGKLQVLYQPIVNLTTRRVVGAEALARWNDEEGNPVSPDVFIKIAEEHGFVGSITKMVIGRALGDFTEILRNQPEFRVSVNVAANDLVDPAFMTMLNHSLERAKLPSSSLVIEITERSTAQSPVAMETIRELRRQGHSIHIDDFGTGYSNLDKLLYLFADTIKIDKAFTGVIGTDAVTVAILPQILALAKSLHLEVVVEGVETEAQADYFSLVRQKVYGQGWLYGRPVTAEAFQHLMAPNCSKKVISVEPAGIRIARSRATQSPRIA